MRWTQPPAAAREATATAEAEAEPKVTGAQGLGWGQGALGGVSKEGLPGEKTRRAIGINQMKGGEVEGQSGPSQRDSPWDQEAGRAGWLSAGTLVLWGGCGMRPERRVRRLASEAVKGWDVTGTGEDGVA